MFCVNTWLKSIHISCMFVSCSTHGWWFVLLSMCLCFCFVWAHGFCLSFLCAMSIVLTPPILLPDYWLIFPTCVYLVTLLICSLYNLLVFAVLFQFVIDVTLWCVLSCPARPTHIASLFSPTGWFLFVAILFIFIVNKAHYSAVLSPRLIPLAKPWQGGGSECTALSLHLQNHNWGALEQGNKPPNDPRAPQHKWLPTARVCVYFGWNKFRTQIPSMCHHTWLYVMSLSLYDSHKWLKISKLLNYRF